MYICKYALNHFERLPTLLGFLLLSSPWIALANNAVDSPELVREQSGGYDTSLIRGAGHSDLSRIGKGQASVLPGTYDLDTIVNGDGVGRLKVELKSAPPSSELQPCITLDMLQRIGLARRYLDALVEQGAAECVNLQLLDAQAVAALELEQLRLTLSIPQMYLEQARRGYVDSSYWDRGVNAGFVNYQANARHDLRHGEGQSSFFLGLSNGLNLGGWRLRNESSLMRNQHQSTKFSSNRSFVQRDVMALKSQASAGELYSNGQVFDSVRFQGVQLSSDEGMLADSERGYAPVVRGVAETNATVEVRQNGYMLSSTQVPPGPFLLKDIYPSGSNGDLEVTIIEANGSRRVYLQPFSALPLMVRKGYLRYSTEIGRYKSNNKELDTPVFASMSGTYGLTEDLSVTSGAQVAENFQALNLGLGGNTPIGAISVDITQSFSRQQGRTLTGQSIRGLFAKTLTHTNTTVTLAAYRYSTSGYRTLDGHVRDLYNLHHAYTVASMYSRARFDLNITQSLGQNERYGNFYLNAQRESFWNGETSSSVTAGYGNTWRNISYNLSLSHTRNLYGLNRRKDNILMLTLSVPLGKNGGAPRMSASYDHTEDGGAMSASVYGQMPEHENVNLSAQMTRTRNHRVSGSAGLGAELPAVALGASLGAGDHYLSTSLNARGAIVAHAGGLNFSRDVGDGFALVQVDGVQGVGLGNGLARTAANGYAVYPTTQPYRFNTIRLDSGSLGADVELDSLTRTVVPHRGAIVKAEFKGFTGRRVQLRLSDAQGQRLPLGAEVLDAAGKSLGLVDHHGQALVLVAEDKGELQITWGEGQQCQASYALPERDPKRYYDKLDLTCR